MFKTTKITILAALVTLAACQDAPDATAPDINPSFAKTTILPDGEAIGVLPDTVSNRTRNRIEFHKGQVMAATSNLYLIWYGAWQYYDSAAIPIITDFVTSLGGSAYFATVRHYPDSRAVPPSGGLVYGGATTDMYSHSSTLTKADIADVVQQVLARGDLPYDTRGIYVVLGSPDISAEGFVSDYCAMHNYANMNGSNIKYIFIGSPARAPAACAPQYIGPNGTTGADGIVSHMAAELANTITDPQFTAWYDRLGLEMADKCTWDFGTTYTAPNGARANVKLGTRHYLLQQLWRPSKSGGECTLASP